MIKVTLIFISTFLLLGQHCNGQADTTYYQGSFSFTRGDSTFYYKKNGTLTNVSIKLPKGINKGVSYFPSGKIAHIDFTRANKTGDRNEKYGKDLGFYENGNRKFYVKYKNGEPSSPSYVYYQNGSIQCKTYWNKLGEKKRQICYDENGNKTNDVKIFGRNDVRIDECNCDD